MNSTYKYLKSLDSIRDRNQLLLQFPQCLKSFDVNLNQIDHVVDNILNLIKRDYPSPSDIPPHSRWRHFDVGNIPRIQHLLSTQWKNVESTERIRLLIDLFVVSVLLDAGAGDLWKYKADDSIYCGDTQTQNKNHVYYSRSEGLAIASLDWFLSGGFASDGKSHRCDAQGLNSITVENLEKAFQVSDSANPLVGAQGRCELLKRLGSVCEEFPNYFKYSEFARPGHLVDYLLNHPDTEILVNENGQNRYHIDISVLWEVVVEGFGGIWPPTRTQYNGCSLGDVWPSEAMKDISSMIGTAGLENDKAKSVLEKTEPQVRNLVCFHKLSQWLTYSLMEPLGLLGVQFKNVHKMTGLAEYRNGGLFVDMDVLTLKPSLAQKFSENEIPTFHVHDDTVVEWRALTVALLDLVGEKVREKLGVNEQQLPLVKVLEAGTWKAGREIAAKKRPSTKGPPIKIISDGTVF